ncbi:hypothetical protein DID88_009507 [Monilinia fructigena]|uniref:Uncharacterized protein n=1 Tax=Monilinia fructigena TaxID=38457 RepID=A0A395IPN2_9HELO|nr:hypothetical protein DID88_009507 [Monilinia fructigena]
MLRYQDRAQRLANSIAGIFRAGGTGNVLDYTHTDLTESTKNFSTAGRGIVEVDLLQSVMTTDGQDADAKVGSLVTTRWRFWVEDQLITYQGFWPQQTTPEDTIQQKDAGFPDPYSDYINRASSSSSSKTASSSSFSKTSLGSILKISTIESSRSSSSSFKTSTIKPPSSPGSTLKIITIKPPTSSSAASKTTPVSSKAPTSTNASTTQTFKHTINPTNTSTYPAAISRLSCTASSVTLTITSKPTPTPAKPKPTWTLWTDCPVNFCPDAGAAKGSIDGKCICFT